MLITKCREEMAALELGAQLLNQFEFMGSYIDCYANEPSLLQCLRDNFAQTATNSSIATPHIRAYFTQNTSLYSRLHGKLQQAVPQINAMDKYIDIPLHEDVDLIYRKEPDDRSLGSFCILFKQSRQVLMVPFADVRRYPIHAMLVIHKTFQMLLLVHGWALFHAACAEKDGVGICITGGKHAGKTSTLVNMLSSIGCDLIANDKVLLRGGDKRVEVCAPPEKVNIRIGTVLHNERLRQWCRDTARTIYPNMRFDDMVEIEKATLTQDLPRRSEKVVLALRELCAVYDVALVPKTELKLLLMPVFRPNLKRSRLIRQTASAITLNLMSHFVAVSRHKMRLDRLFDFDEPALEKRQASLVQDYFGSLPIYELQQSAETNAHSAELVQELIDREKARL